MAQAILDMFPDAISQFGLIGCAAFVLAILALSWACLNAMASRSIKRAEWRYDRVSRDLINRPGLDARLKEHNARVFREWPHGSAPRQYGRNVRK